MKLLETEKTPLTAHLCNEVTLEKKGSSLTQGRPGFFSEGIRPKPLKH